MIKADIRGLPELARKLNQLGDKVAGDYLERATLGGAEVIRKEASDLAPKGRTRKLTENIILETKEKSRNRVSIGIGPSTEVVSPGGVPYPKFVELGTSKMRSQPFLRPALDGSGPGVVLAMIKFLRGALRI